MKDLPGIIKDINKSYKTIKVTTLSRAKSFEIKRFFSGSFGVDFITGGGFAYKRILLLYGARSAGKNSHLYQSIAYNQRMCRVCGGILPDYITTEPSTNFIKGIDRWSGILLDYMSVPVCNCGQALPKIFMILDYEKSLGYEDAKSITVKFIIDTATNANVAEDEYDEKLDAYNLLKKKKGLSAEEKQELKDFEAWQKTLTITENTIEQLSTPDYLKSCGVLIDDLLVVDPDDTDEGVDIVKAVVRSNDVDGIIWDSLQAAIPKYVKDRSAEEATMGVEAKMNGLLMRQICAAFSSRNLEDPTEAIKPCVIVTSQVRNSLGGMHSGPATFSGGNALAHHISLALEFKRECFLKADGTEAPFKETYYGQRVRIRADKNKLAAPGDHIFYNYYFRTGDQFSMGEIDHIEELTTLAVDYGLISRAGAYYDVLDQRFQGKKAVVDFIRENPKFAGELYKSLNAGVRRKTIDVKVKEQQENSD